MWGRSLLQMLAEAGFVEGRIHGWTGYHTSSCTEGALDHGPETSVSETLESEIVTIADVLTGIGASK